MASYIHCLFSSGIKPVKFLALAEKSANPNGLGVICESSSINTFGVHIVGKGELNKAGLRLSIM